MKPKYCWEKRCNWGNKVEHYTKQATDKYRG